jgi:hypothetical protein
MKLDDAYNAWGGQSENSELAQKTKKIFHNIWWLIPTNQPCNYYTLPVLARALQQANGAQSDKVKAASVMVHVLNYAHNVDPEGNNKPDFTFSDIVNYTGEKDAAEQTREKDDRGQVPGSSQTRENAPARDLSPVIPANEDAPLVSVKPAAKAAIKREKNDAGIGSSEREQARSDNGKAKRMAELAKRDGGKAAEKAAKAVVQLDAETLKPVKVWPSCFSAQKELGVKNVQRAISRCGLAGGFYWCRPGDEETFKPADMRTHNGAKKTVKSETHRITPITEEPKPLPKITFKPTEEEKELIKRVFDGPDRQQVREDDRGRVPVRIDERPSFVYSLMY